MKPLARYSAIALTLASLLSCRSVSTAPAAATIVSAAQVIPDEGLNSTLWDQTAAEYEALALQAFQAARARLEQALGDPTWTAATEQTADFSRLPPAIILDIDETVLKHTAYQARLAKTHQLHSSEKFVAYLKENKADPVPGAVEFLRHARERGVSIFFIGNAASEEYERANLSRLGFPLETDFDNVLMPGDDPSFGSNKSSRRALVASRYRVLFLFGDDLNDFVVASGLDIATRAAIVRQHLSKWGARWYVIPNPMYGSWERAIFGGTSPASHQEQIKGKYEALDTKE